MATKALNKSRKKIKNPINILLTWMSMVMFVHGWWKQDPPTMWHRMNMQKGHPIHKIYCKGCKENWYTSCPVSVCAKLGCWFKYAKENGGI